MAAKKGGKSNKTAHVLNLLTAPGGEKETPAVDAPQVPPAETDAVPPQAEALCAVLKDLLEGRGFPPPAPQRCGQLHCRVGAGRLDEKIEKLMRREG